MASTEAQFKEQLAHSLLRMGLTFSELRLHKPTIGPEVFEVWHRGKRLLALRYADVVALVGWNDESKLDQYVLERMYS